MVDPRHLRMGGTPVLPGRTWGEGKGEEKWKREELAPLRLSLGDKRDSQAGRGPPTVGMWRDLGGIIGSKVNTLTVTTTASTGSSCPESQNALACVSLFFPHDTLRRSSGCALLAPHSRKGKLRLQNLLINTGNPTQCFREGNPKRRRELA